MKTHTTSKDTLDLKALVAQLSTTLELLKDQEEQKKRKISFKQTLRDNTELKDDFEEETEVIYVNIWNKVDGELKLLGQKPMLKDTFKKMHKKKDFSSLLTLEAKPLTSIEIRPQTVVSKPLLKKPQFANKKTNM